MVLGDHRTLAERYPIGHPFHAPMMAALQRVPPDRPAGAQAVTNCNDTGPGSLRDAVENAVSGDVVDLGDLVCSPITLSSGTLITAVDDLTITGPETGIAVFAGADAQVIVHLGAGTLDVSDVTLLGGSKYVDGGAAAGGCIYSQGVVALQESAVKYCQVETTGDFNARGGGVFAAGGVTLTSSVIAANAALSEIGSEGRGYGGGVFSGGGAIIVDSTVSLNEATRSGGGLLTQGGLIAKYSTFDGNEATNGFGGGIASRSDSVTITHSTISNNTATHAGGLDLTSVDPSDTALIQNSTIAFNEGTDTRFGGGIYSGLDLSLESCTISGNIERHDQGEKYGGGLRMSSGSSLQMRNTIVSGNQRLTIGGDAPIASDISAAGGAPLVATGAGNMVDFVTNVTLPAGTIDAQPELGPLQDNGGTTETMLPLAGSLAVDAGVSSTFTVDQRGTGFARQVGPAVDIGAVEFDPVLFADGFED